MIISHIIITLTLRYSLGMYIWPPLAKQGELFLLLYPIPSRDGWIIPAGSGRDGYYDIAPAGKGGAEAAKLRCPCGNQAQCHQPTRCTFLASNLSFQVSLITV